MATVSDAYQYADAIIKGRIPACKWVRLACERFFRDLSRAETDEFPYRFDEEQAQLVLDFFGLCRHSKGGWGGQAFETEAWQTFITCQIFGWVHKLTRLRRFRTAYVSVGRKNGKTTWAAPIGLYMLAMDGEQGSEVYAAATKRDQARAIFEESKRMVKSSPALRAYIGVHKDRLYVESTNSTYTPLGADADTLDGLNPHCNLVDELHAHKTRELWDVLETGTGARTQSLQLAITTAGFASEGICLEQEHYAQQVLEGVIEDETYFGIVYTVDEAEKADPARLLTDESLWQKANPNWGVSVLPDDMRRLAAKARRVTSAQNTFLCKRLNIWTQQAERWLDVAQWNQSGNPFDPADLEGRACFGGLDLSTKLDLTAWVLVFPPIEKGEPWKVLCRFWVPKENIESRSLDDRVPYGVWAKEGFIEATEGNVVDYDVIVDRIKEDAARYSIQEIAFDPWNATATVLDLQGDGLTMVETRQGMKSMSLPSKELEGMIRAGTIAHNSHPVLRWCVSNVAIRRDSNENYMPDKKKSAERIDGVVAMIMALGRALVHQSDDSGSLDDFLANPVVANR